MRVSPEIAVADAGQRGPFFPRGGDPGARFFGKLEGITEKTMTAHFG